MATSTDHRRVTKRSSNACSRCRRQKIKCSGQQPCVNCEKRNLNCMFDDRDNKIMVTQGYLSDLHTRLTHLERNHESVSTAAETQPAEEDDGNGDDERRETPGHHQQAVGLSSPGHTRESSPMSGENPEDTDLTNPMVESSKFMSSSTGRSFYLGTSSNWSFHGQILNLVHQHIRKSPLPSADLLFDGSAYDLPWDGSRAPPDLIIPIIPSMETAIYLIDAVKFHCAHLVHLFEEEEFSTNLCAFYSNSGNTELKESLWYIHFLVLIAFGKTFVQHRPRSPRPSGADLFVHALKLLPDTNRLCREPVIAVEILCCISLYLQALDSRTAAHVTIGQAMRIALAEGMHTDMPMTALGEALVQRCRKIWWTIYILDRQMTSLMGLPQSIRDDDISCRIPSSLGSVQQAATLVMQIKLARIAANISRSVYGSRGRLRKRLVVSMKAVLDELTVLAPELRQSFPLKPDHRFDGISRMSAHLHLLYYQNVVVVTRPLLFCCMKKIFEDSRDLEPLLTSIIIRQLLDMSLEASQKLLRILDSLQSQDLLETFLPWDLDALFVSTMIIILTGFIQAGLPVNRFTYLDKAFGLLDYMASNGNRVAAFRVIELRKLDEMLETYLTDQMQLSSTSTMYGSGIANQYTSLGSSFPGGHQSTAVVDDPLPPPPTGLSDEGSGFGDDLTVEQILAGAESIDFETTDWLSFATLDNDYPIIDPRA